LHKVVKSIELLFEYDIILLVKYRIKTIYCCKIIRAEFVSMFKGTYSKGLRLLGIRDFDDILDKIK